jgi:hypothetical protein
MSTTAHAPGSSQKTHIAIVGSLFVVTVVSLYLFRASEQTNNALFYLHAAATGVRLFEPPAHLLYGAILRLLHSAISSFASFNSIWAGQIHGLVWATVAVISIYMIVQRVIGSAIVGLIAAIFMLVLNGFWTYSTQAETYVPMLAPLALLGALIVCHSEHALSWRERLAYSALLFASIMYHQMGVLFVIPLSYYFIFKWGRSGAKDLIIILFISGMATLSAYLLVFVMTQPGSVIKDFIHWVLHYRYEFDELGKISHFNIKSLLQFIQSQLNSLVVLPKGLGILQKPLSVFLLMLPAIALIWNTVQVLRKANHYHVRAFFLIWYVTYAVFCIWWNPSVYKFLFPTLVPIVVLSTLMFYDVLVSIKYKFYLRSIVPLFLAVLFISITSLNFHYSFLPIHESKGPYYKDAVYLHESVDPSCNIYVNSNVAFNLMYYFDVQRAESLKKLFIEFHEDTSNDKDRFNNEYCTLTPVSAISPLYYSNKSQQYNLNQPWSEFIKWIFGVEALGPTVTYHPYKVMDDAAGMHYFVIDRTSRIELDQLESLLTQVLEDVERVSESESAALVSRGDRNKKLIFGY